MYKYYKKDNYYVMDYYFDSIVEMLDFIDTHETESAFIGHSLSSTEKGDYNWYLSKSLDEAKDLIKYGYHEGFDKLVNLKLKLEKFIKLSNKKSRQYNYYVGYAPDVKAYLEGSPLSMLNKNEKERRKIDVYYNSSNLSNVSSAEIFNRGAVTLCIVEILENLGFNVNLNVFTMSREGNQIHYVALNIKKTGERLNLQKLYFPLAHPSFLRRLVFRIREQTPDITRDWCSSYGSTCGISEIKKILDLNDNDIVICKADEMGVKGNDIIADANAMFEFINNSQTNELQFQKIKKI